MSGRLFKGEKLKYYLTGRQAQSVDIFTQNKIGIPGLVLMEKAAERLAEEIDSYICKNMVPGEAAFDKNKKNAKGFDRQKIRIVSVVEGGNNGGDAVAAARILKSGEYGYDTYVYEINGISSKSQSYLKQIEIAENLGVRFLSGKLCESDLETAEYKQRIESEDEESDDSEPVMDMFCDFDIIIDGVFGVGLSRPVKGIQKQIIERINYARKHPARLMGLTVFGVDIPSGISSDNGHVLGVAVDCDITVTFQYIKLGMLINEGREKSGGIICRDIGLCNIDNESGFELMGIYEEKGKKLKRILGEQSDKCVFEYDAEETAFIRPSRISGSNKGTYGKVLIIAGSKDIYGALYLSAGAAYATGSGLVKVVTDERNRDVLTEKLPESMMLTYDTEELAQFCPASDLSSISEIHMSAEDCLKRMDDDSVEYSSGKFCEKLSASVKWADVILAGPGLGTSSVSELILRTTIDACEKGKKLVLDADALNIISKDSGLQLLSAAVRKCGKNNVIITPHILEMKRLITSQKGEDISIEVIKNAPTSVAQEMSDTFGIITVLKDARTVVTSSHGIDDAGDNTSDGNMETAPIALIYLNTTGNSGMSKGGSGDVLAGIIAGNLAQIKAFEKNEEPSAVGKHYYPDISDWTAEVFGNVCVSVNMHGLAGDKAAELKGEYSMLASDMLNFLNE